MKPGDRLDDADRAIRAKLAEHGRKCRLCEVIVQPALTGSLEDGMSLHRAMVHGINR